MAQYELLSESGFDEITFHRAKIHSIKEKFYFDRNIRDRESRTMNNPDTIDSNNIIQNENNSPSNNEAVLGGIERVKQRLNSNNVEVVIAALKEAVNYQDDGLDLVITALQERLLKKHESGEHILTTEQYYQLIADNRSTQDFTGLVGLDLTQVEFRDKNFELTRPNLSHTI